MTSTWVCRGLCMVMLVACGREVFAQQVSVTGVVIDARTARPLAGVHLVVDDGLSDAESDAEGRFSVSLPPGTYTLRAAIVGYALGELAIVVPSSGLTDVIIRLSEGTGAYTERVTVVGAGAPDASSAPAGVALYGRELQTLRGLMLDDPLRAAQALPSATATDDFYSEFAVRGNTFRHVGLAIDGMPTRYLMHSVHGVTDGGSISSVNSDILGTVSLSPGSYPQKHGRRIGAHLDLSTRDASRDGFRGRAGLSGTSASVLLEGPLRGRKGSWLVSARRSYLDYLVKRIDEDASWIFGFTDAQAKVVYDLGSRHRLQGLAIVGSARFNEDPATLTANDEARADSRSWLSALTWRFSPGSRYLMFNRVYFTGVTFENRSQSNAMLDAGTSKDLGWRMDNSVVLPAGAVLEFGMELQHLAGRHRQQRVLDSSSELTVMSDYSEEAASRSAYAQVTLTPSSRLRLTPGARIDYWELTGDVRSSPWLTAQWTLNSKTRLRAGTGTYRQFPEFAHVFGVRGAGTGLGSETAMHVDAGVEHSLGAGTTLQMTWYRRVEEEILRAADAEPRRLPDGSIARGRGDARWSNTLRGRARGVEAVIRREDASGLSGWAGYAYGRHRYDDSATGESFWSDADQRHTLSLFGAYRLSSRSTISAKFRYGSNYPLVGYIGEQQPEAGAPRLFGGERPIFLGLTTERNTLRLPAYARLDVRADRTFQWGSRRVTAFAEVANALNRANLRNVPCGVDSRGRVSGATDSLMPIVPSVGLVVEF